MSRDILITPHRGSTGSNQYPEISFNGLSASSIKLKVDDDGSVVYTGTYGVLFNINDKKDGLLHSINDVSGLPILSVYSYDYVQMGKWNKNTLVVNSDKVGVGLTGPTTPFHIYSTQSGAFRLQDGSQGLNKILVSDANGVGTWTTAASSGLTGVGVVNYIPKWNGVSSLSGTSSIYDDGNVGIGSSTPLFKLSVVTTVDGDGIFLMNNSSQYLASFQRDPNGGTPKGYIALYDSSGNTQVIINSPTYAQSDFVNTGRNFGIGSGFSLAVGATSKLHVQGSDSTSSNYSLKLDNSSATSLLSVRNDGIISALPTYGTSSNSGTYSLLGIDSTGKLFNTGITSSGILGTGTINYVPRWVSSNTLSGISSIYDDGTHVNIGLTGATTSRLAIMTEDNLITSYGLRVYQNVTGNDLFYIKGNGHSSFSTSTVLGVGTNADPSTRLAIQGIGGTGSNNILIAYPQGGALIGLIVKENTNVGVGKQDQTPTARLHVQGISAISSEYAFKVDNVTPDALFYVRNDGYISNTSTSDSASVFFGNKFSGTDTLKIQADNAGRGLVITENSNITGGNAIQFVVSNSGTRTIRGLSNYTSATIDNLSIETTGLSIGNSIFTPSATVHIRTTGTQSSNGYYIESANLVSLLSGNESGTIFNAANGGLHIRKSSGYGLGGTFLGNDATYNYDSLNIGIFGIGAYISMSHTNGDTTIWTAATIGGSSRGNIGYSARVGISGDGSLGLRNIGFGYNGGSGNTMYAIGNEDDLLNTTIRLKHNPSQFGYFGLIDQEANNSWRIGIGTASVSTHRVIISEGLMILGSQSGTALRINDGTQANGYVLTSDSNGNASWAPSLNSHISDNNNPHSTTLQQVVTASPILNDPITSQDGNTYLSISNYNLNLVTDGFLTLEGASVTKNGVEIATINDLSTSSWALTGNIGTSASTNFIGTTDNTDFVVRTNNLEVSRFKSNGQLSIGTASIASRVTISATGSGEVALYLNTSAAQDTKLFLGTNNSANSRLRIYVEDSTQTSNLYTVNSDTIFWNGNGLAQAKTLTLYTDTSAKFEKSVLVGSVINIDGIDATNYPININSSNATLTRLRVNNGGNTQTDIQLSNNNGSNALYIGVNNATSAFIDNRSGGNLLFRNGGTTNMTFDTSGKLGIGVTPTYKLDVSSSAATAFRVSTVATFNSAVIQSDQYSSSLSIDSAVSGPVGGYNSALVLNSNGVFRGSFNAESTTSVTTLESAGGYWLLLKNSTTESIGLGQGGNYIQFSTNGVSRMYLEGSTGNLSIGGATVSARVHIRGIDSTSSNYAFKVENSLYDPIISMRNDGLILSLPIYATTSFTGTSGLVGIDSTGKLYNTGITPSSVGGGGGGGITGTGTNNYIPRWTSSTNLSGTSSIYDNGTNTGIGTQSSTASRVTIFGIDDTSSNYGLRVQNSSNIDSLSIRNDGAILSLPTYGTSSFTGTAGVVGVDSTGKLYNTGFNPSASTTGTIGIGLDGGGAVISTGFKQNLIVPYNCVITGWSVLASVTGSCVIDVWKSTGSLPNASNSIAGTEKPSLSSQIMNTDNALTTWTASCTSGDIIGFNVDSISLIDNLTLILKINKI